MFYEKTTKELGLKLKVGNLWVSVPGLDISKIILSQNENDADIFKDFESSIIKSIFKQFLNVRAFLVTEVQEDKTEDIRKYNNF